MVKTYWMPAELIEPWARYLALHGQKSSTVIVELIEERLITAGLVFPDPDKEAQP